MSKNDLQISPLFLLFTCFFLTLLLVSNIIAGKMVELGGITLPAGAILFPLTYIFGDLLTEVYGFKKARLIIWTGFGANLFMVLVFMLTLALPYPEFWRGQEAFQTVLGLTPRLLTASLMAYMVGEFFNSMILSKLKVRTKGKLLWVRTIGSTIIGEGLDTILFITIAFVGTLPLSVLGGIILAQYFWKVAYEVAVTPFTYLLVHWVKRREGLDVYDTGVQYHPFRWEL